MIATAVYAAVRPDGQQVAALEHIIFGFSGTYLKVFDAAGKQIVSGPEPFRYSLGWAPDGGILLPWQGQQTGGDICRAVDDGGSWMCAQRVASDPPNILGFPAVSPGGNELAVSDGGRIAIFSYPSGSLLRVLTAGPGDSTPAWSPDGSRIVFQRSDGTVSGSQVVVIGADGSGERVLVSSSAETPTWGGADPGSPPAGPGGGDGGGGGGGGAPAATATLSAAPKQRGTTVRARVTIPASGSRLTATVRTTNGKLLGRLTAKNLAAGTRTIKVRLTKYGRALLRRKRVMTVRFAVTVTGPAGSSALRVTVRLRR